MFVRLQHSIPYAAQYCTLLLIVCAVFVTVRPQRVVHVYGYSGAFGTAPHELSVALIRKWYPLYNPDHIYCSYEGY